MADRKERRRSRTRPQSGDSGGGSSTLKRGRQGIETGKKERQERELEYQSRGPRRHWMKQGEERELLVLDNTVEDIAWLHEHHIPGPGNDFKNSIHVPCLKESETCPLCEKAAQGGKNSRFRSSDYIMMVSVLDLTPFTRKDGTEAYAAKRLLAVKSGQQEDFIRLFDACEKKNGKIRGMIMLMKRDTGAATSSPNIGKPIMNEDGEMYDFIDEDDIYDDYGHDKVVNDAGKTVKEADSDCEPFDYEKIIHFQTAEQLRSVYGGSATPGSRADTDAEWGSGDDDDGEVSRRSRRRRRASDRPSKPSQDQDEGRTRRRRAEAEPEEETEEEEARPARRSRRRSAEEEEAKPASRRPRRRVREEEPEEEEYEEEEGEDEDEGEEEGPEEEEAPARTRRRRARAEEPEEEEEDTRPRRTNRRGRIRRRTGEVI